MQSILDHGMVIRGWLGVTIQELKPDLADALDVKPSSGVLVSDVQADTPAAKAGVKQRDIIVKVDGKRVTTTSQLRNRIAAAGAGKRVTLDILRDGKNRRISLELGELPNDEGKLAGSPGRPGTVDGLAIAPLSPDLRKKYDISEKLRTGVIVTDVDEGSVGAFAGLRPGDVILEVNREPVSGAESFRQAWSKAKDRVLLLVHRGGATIFMVVTKK
jgi:serine protease Do